MIIVANNCLELTWRAFVGGPMLHFKWINFTAFLQRNCGIYGESMNETEWILGEDRHFFVVEKIDIVSFKYVFLV